jgi:hypothetical protein
MPAVIDDTDMAPSTRWHHLQDTAFLDGSASRVAQAGAQLALGPVTVRKLSVLAATSPSGGHLVVQVGDQRLRIDLTSPDITEPHPIAVPIPEPVTGTLTLTAKPHAGGHVTIDGLLLN